jgi:hypothetical protein
VEYFKGVKWIQWLRMGFRRGGGGCFKHVSEIRNPEDRQFLTSWNSSKLILCDVINFYAHVSVFSSKFDLEEHYCNVRSFRIALY